MAYNEAGPSRSRCSSHPPSPCSTLRRKRRLGDVDEPVHYVLPTSPPNLRGGGHPRTRHKRDSSPHRKGPPDAVRKRVTRAQARRGSSPSLATDLEAIAAEDEAVKHEISRLSLGLRDVQGDGNCLFRAVADQLWGVQKRHVEVRKLVCDYLETHKASMEAFVAPFMKVGEAYEGYVERMRQLTQFGSHIEIQAAARVFRRNIRVVMSTTSFTIPWQTESSSAPTPKPPDDDETHPRRRTRSCTTSLLATPAAPPPSSPSYATALADYIPSIRPGRSMLWLALFSQAEHFQSVRRKGDGDSGAAEIEDRLAIPHEKDVSEAARRERGEIADVNNGKVPTKVTEVLASLPPGHGVTETQASGVLARVRGDLGEAVEILLEELELDESHSDASNHYIEKLLAPVHEAKEYLAHSPPSSPSSSHSETAASARSDTSATSKMTTPSEGSPGKGKSSNSSGVAQGISELKLLSQSPGKRGKNVLRGVSRNAGRSRMRRAHAVMA